MKDKNMYLDLLKKVLTASVYEESAWKIKEKRSGFMRHVFRFLKRKSVLIIKMRPFDMDRRLNGNDWPMFGFTMTGHKRLDNLQYCVEMILKNKITGDLVETGVWRGGSSIFMQALLKTYQVTDRKIWLADSFEGMPVPKNESDGWDYSQSDYLSVSMEQVKKNFSKFDLLDDNLIFLKGWFSDTLPGAPIDKIALLRLDGDLYSSTMDSLTNLYHKVTSGGFVIVDDYYSWPACQQAVHDYLKSKNITVEIQRIDGDGAYWQVQ